VAYLGALDLEITLALTIGERCWWWPIAGYDDKKIEKAIAARAGTSLIALSKTRSVKSQGARSEYSQISAVVPH